MTIATAEFSSNILMVTIGACEDALTIVEEIGGTPALNDIGNGKWKMAYRGYKRRRHGYSLWIEEAETRLNGDVFWLRRCSIV